MIRKCIDSYLSKHPYYTSWNSVQVKVSSVTDIPSARRLKHGLGYLHNWVLDSGPRVICDLGCNTGLFPLWIYAQTGIRVRGLFVDANLEMVHRCSYNLLNNGFSLKDCRFVYGLVGEEINTKFIVKPSHQSSDCYPSMESGIEGLIISPPDINIAELWGQKEGDLLKVDIEGSELGLLKSGDHRFFSLFKKIIVEYHEPLCDVSMIRLLMPNNFTLTHVTGAGTTCGNTYWVRR